MVEERIIPSEDSEENPNLVGVPDDSENLVGVAKEEEEEGEDLSDLFEAPKQGYEKEDISDIFEVSEEDIMGEDEGEEGIEDLFEAGEEPEAPHWSDEDIKRYEQIQKKQQARKPTYRRTAKRYTPPQIGGVE